MAIPSSHSPIVLWVEAIQSALNYRIMYAYLCNTLWDSITCVPNHKDASIHFGERCSEPSRVRIRGLFERHRTTLCRASRGSKLVIQREDGLE